MYTREYPNSKATGMLYGLFIDHDKVMISNRRDSNELRSLRTTVISIHLPSTCLIFDLSSQNVQYPSCYSDDLSIRDVSLPSLFFLYSTPFKDYRTLPIRVETNLNIDYGMEEEGGNR